MAFTLRNIRSDDRRAFGQVEAFFLDNSDPGVRIRPEEQLMRALGSGQGLMVTDGARVCGISLVYQFDIPPKGPVYSEVGTVRITANGYGFQSLLVKLHLLQVRLEEYGTDLPLVFAVVSPDTPSAHNLERRVGMSLWDPPPDLAATRGAAGVPFSPSKQVLLAPPRAFASAVVDLRSWSRPDGALASPKGDAIVHVDLGWFGPEVLSAI